MKYLLLLLATITTASRSTATQTSESLKLLPKFNKNEALNYTLTTSKYAADSLGVIRLADTSYAEVEIISLSKSNDGFLLGWTFSNYYIDTAILTVAEKPGTISFLKAINGLTCKIKLDKQGMFEEFVNEEELYERMDANNEAEEAIKEELEESGRSEKRSEMADLMMDLMRYKIVEKKFFPVFATFASLYGKTYIRDSLISADALEAQLKDPDDEADDALTKMLTASFENSMKRNGGAIMTIPSDRSSVGITYDVSIDMSEMMSGMAGLFSGMASEMAGGFAEAFGTDSTGAAPDAETIDLAKDKIREEMEAAMKDMKMIARNILVAEYDPVTHQPRSITDQKIVEGTAEGRDQYERQSIFFRKRVQ